MSRERLMRCAPFLLVLLHVSGCVWEERCVAGAARDDATGRCRLAQGDAGRDAGASDAGADAGADDAGADDAGADAGTDAATDGGTLDGGPDAGPPRTIEQFAVGASHICVIDSEQALTCWGSNLLGALATGDVAVYPLPRRVALGGPVTAVTGISTHSCAQTGEPALYCWGSNGSGQIGNAIASPDPVTSPHRLALGAARSIVASIANSCFTNVFGEATCWGRNDFGQLASGMASADVSMPGMQVQTSGGRLENISQVSFGDRHACFLLNSIAEGLDHNAGCRP